MLEQATVVRCLLRLRRRRRVPDLVISRRTLRRSRL